MRIVKQRGDAGGVEMELVVVQNDGRNFVYFSPVGATSVPLDAPHFVVDPSIPYGDAMAIIDPLKNRFTEFVCSDFADSAELTELRAKYDDLKRWRVDDEELEALRADRAELERMQFEEREVAQLKARLVELLTPPAMRVAASNPGQRETINACC